MKIFSYEKLVGRLKILEMCNYSLIDVRQHLKRECQLKSNYDLSKYMKIYKQLLEEKTQPSRKSELCKEILNKLGVMRNDN